MREYLNTRYQCFCEGRKLSMKHDLPDFKHIHGKKQIDYRIRKREHDTEKHGYTKVEDLLKKKRGLKLSFQKSEILA